MIIGNTKGFIRGKALSVEGHTHSEYAASSHTHDDRYYTESEMNSLLAGKAAASHNHDDRYYTEGEVSSLLAGKAANVHTHTMDQIASLVEEINSLKSSVSEGKALIAAAVTGKGVSTAADASFATIAQNIQKIAVGYTSMSYRNRTTGYIPTLSKSASYAQDSGTVDISSGNATLYINNPGGSDNTVNFTFS